VQDEQLDPISPDDDPAPLLAAASRGDSAAWSGLVGRYSRRVYALAKSRLRDHDVAEDLTQSVFATLAEKLSRGEYSELGRFEAWLFRVAANRVRDHVRRMRLRPSPHDPEVLDASNAAPSHATPDDTGHLQRSRLRLAIERLTDLDRDIIELRHHGGLSFKQIAEVLQEPLGTLLARHHRALRKLKDLLESDEAFTSSESPQAD
jgi:RNA polymerase sigma-70 factor (ECF subfamily)